MQTQMCQCRSEDSQTVCNFEWFINADGYREWIPWKWFRFRYYEFTIVSSPKCGWETSSEAQSWRTITRKLVQVSLLCGLCWSCLSSCFSNGSFDSDVSSHDLQITTTRKKRGSVERKQLNPPHRPVTRNYYRKNYDNLDACGDSKRFALGRTIWA